MLLKDIIDPAQRFLVVLLIALTTSLLFIPVHEYGHYLAAKYMGLEVTEFVPTMFIGKPHVSVLVSNDLPTVNKFILAMSGSGLVLLFIFIILIVAYLRKEYFLVSAMLIAASISLSFGYDDFLDFLSWAKIPISYFGIFLYFILAFFALGIYYFILYEVRRLGSRG